jgi:hypothetical protein
MTGFKKMTGCKAIGFKLALSGTAALTALAAFASPAQAAIEYPWCVQYGAGMDGGGGRNCGFVSYEQCMMTARGAGGWCEQNLFYLDQVAKQRQQPRKRSHND